MKPVLSILSDEDEILKSLIKCISDIECSKFFTNHIGQHQTAQSAIVGDFQTLVWSSLCSTFPNIEWSQEHHPCATSKDSIDIFGKKDGFAVVIELDKSRADQVAKKFVSRMAILPSTTAYYISLCYPGTNYMNKKECKKYFGYCSKIASQMNSHYAGFIIN